MQSQNDAAVHSTSSQRSRTATIKENVNLVAGDVNGAGWQRKVGVEQKNDSTLEEALSKARLHVSQGPHTVVGPCGTWRDQAEVCSKPRLPK